MAPWSPITPLSYAELNSAYDLCVVRHKIMPSEPTCLTFFVLTEVKNERGGEAAFERCSVTMVKRVRLLT